MDYELYPVFEPEMMRLQVFYLCIFWLNNFSYIHVSKLYIV